MLDFFLVLGQIPGTSIQLNFYEIVLLPFACFWLYHNHNYQKVYGRIGRTSKSALTSPSFRSFVIWLALTLDKPRGSQLRQRLLGR